MRVALVTDGIWPYVMGGMQKHSYYVCKYLAANGVHVDLFHFNPGPHDIALLQYFTAGEQRFISPVLLQFPRSGRWPGHYLFDSYRYSRAAGQKILERSGGYDFIYAKGFTAWWLLERPAEVRASLPPVAVNFHGFEMFQRAPGLKSLLQYMLLFRVPVKRICRRAQVVFSYGGKITGIIRRLGVPVERIVEIPAGVEIGTVADGVMPSAEITRFVFLGRYERRKGIEELNQAIAMLDPVNRKKAEFHFIGPIPSSRQRENCIYHGPVGDRDHLYRLLRGFDVLVCPSWSEGMPNVILEAMSQGLAVIATNTGATSSLVHRGTGWLLGSPSPLLIKEALQTVIMLSRTELDQRKHNALRLVTSEYVWERIAPRLISEIEKISRLRSGSPCA